MIQINSEACKGCGICISMCPSDVLTFSDEFNSTGFRYPVVKNSDNCTGCGNCMVYCPDFAIVVKNDEE